ncbi:MAG TPA: NAD(P)/FAD-dependent oxidoreductase [Alphaproteobacteria bacterium]
MTATHAPDINTDIVIIGAGPVGLFAVFQCGMLKMNCHVVDSLEIIGGQCAALYPEKPIYDIPAWPHITGQDLIDRLEEQAAPFNPVYHLNQQIVSLEKNEDGYRVGTTKGTFIQCKVVIIAAGAGAFGPNRPPLENLESYEGTSVFYAVKKRDAFAGKHVVIAGGGDSAVDWANSLADIAASVSVVHRRDKFRAAPDSVAKMQKLVEAGKINMAIPTQLHALAGENGQLRQVIVQDDKGAEIALQADVLLPFYGLAASLGPIADWNLDLHKHQIIVDPATNQTSAPGIFAIGDIASYPGKLKLILQGFSEAAMAAHAAYGIVHPDSYLEFTHSTDKGVPGAK